MLKQRLQQKLLQKLSPQQIQMIKLLEIPAIQLEQRIKKELEDNPVLEEGNEEAVYEEGVAENESPGNDQDEFSLEDYMQDDEIPSYRLSTGNYSSDEKREEIPFSVGNTFRELLKTQLGLRNLTEKQEVIAEYVLGNIDDDGYLRRELEAIADDLAFSVGFEASYEEIHEVLMIIQEFDPAGVGARSLQECLLLQIERKNTDDPIIGLARRILKNHFDEFTNKHYDKIVQRLDIDESLLKQALTEILKLNPKPGGAAGDSAGKSIEHIVPDFILEEHEGELQLSLNSGNVPELKISKTYSDMIESYHANKASASREDKNALTFVKQKLDSAKWFIDAIRQRQNTMLLTMNAILEYQRNYFIEGDETRMRPMILKDIAERTGLDISTISRVVNSKYIQTHFGIFPLKYFFSEGMQTDSGEEVSTREIKKILHDCIDGEDKRRPLTDDRLSAILNEKGYQIARRTVAKYREQLGLPVARLRKEL
ncbi:MAG: RNA polymerase factor sigma-54 [Bacteroidales bacterium]|nr:RNA polymerase factor sigma-54 [Bacteroidales bacterium]MBN2698565.1 RNA polymerase factor sigma-54 [Bacteroidales bacterium]